MVSLCIVAAEDTSTDFSKMRAKQLKAYLAARGVDCNGCAEKADWVKAAEESQDLPLLSTQEEEEPLEQGEGYQEGTEGQQGMEEEEPSQAETGVDDKDEEESESSGDQFNVKDHTKKPPSKAKSKSKSKGKKKNKKKSKNKNKNKSKSKSKSKPKKSFGTKWYYPLFFVESFFNLLTTKV